MKTRYGLLICFFALMGCSKSSTAYDEYARDELLDRIETKYQAQDYITTREAAETFVARFPYDDAVDSVRVKLLASYIDTKRYKLAYAYADRLLNSVLVNESYHEDIEYYKIILTIKKSRHWMAELLKMHDVYRNYDELVGVTNEISQFVEKHPHSDRLNELNGFHTELRQALANHELNIALHYAKKANFEAAKLRIERYYANYKDVDSPVLEDLLVYAELR